MAQSSCLGSKFGSRSQGRKVWGSAITSVEKSAPSSALLESEHNILARIAAGGPLEEVLRDLILVVEKPSNGAMLASVLFLSQDGKHLKIGAAPSLPPAYNKAIDGGAIGPKAGSCGTAAHRGEPVFVADIATDPLWADYRKVALVNGLKACWSVPIRAADGRLLGTFANYYREPRTPTERDMEVIAVVAQTTAIAIERHQRELEREKAEEQRTLLLRELNHRVKNVFALTNSLVRMSARSASTPDELCKAMQGRLSALSRAHDLVQPSVGHETDCCDVGLRDVLRDILSPYAITDIEERVRLDGPDVRMSNAAITSIAMICHELATNAAKYGALSQAEGRIAVDWKTNGASLELSWAESGGPALIKPVTSGFGTTLIRRSVEGQLGGTVAYDWAPGGLKVHILLPLAKLVHGWDGQLFLPLAAHREV